MKFFLKRGFGLAKSSYGGNIFIGLAQGSRGVSSARLTVSTLTVCAHKCKGYGVSSYSAWSCILVAILAILYVDDTDLLHMSHNPNISESDFIETVQRATYYWVFLLQAMGGHLKDTVCYWYLLSYKFIQGEATLKSLHELSHYTITIP
jgi:hypothetical protein